MISLAHRIGGTNAWIENTGRQLHKLPNEIVMVRLREDIDYACESSDWFAAVALSDGKIVMVPSSRMVTALLRPGHQTEKIAEIARIANGECHHGGHWVVAWSDGEIHALWRDADGDMQLTNTFPDTWERLSSMHPVDWVEALEACMAEAKARFKELSLKDKHKFMRAQGERRPR